MQSLIHLLIHSINIYWVPVLCQVLVLGIKITTICHLIMYVCASSYELQQRGREKGKLLERPYIAVFSHRATGHCCLALAELAAPSCAACSLLFTASPYSGESNNLDVCTSLYKVLSYLLFKLILSILGGRNYNPNFWVNKLNFKYFMI